MEIKKTTCISEFYFQTKKINVSLGVGRNSINFKRKEEKYTRNVLPIGRKVNTSAVARNGEVVEGCETEMDMKEPTLQITFSIAICM